MRNFLFYTKFIQAVNNEIFLEDLKECNFFKQIDIKHIIVDQN